MQKIVILLVVVVVGFASGDWTPDRCSSDPCRNGTTCHNIFDYVTRKTQAKCCQGPFCEVVPPNACDSLDCFGRCRFIDGRLDSAECVCLPWLTGPNCREYVPMVCASMFCNNRGKCDVDDRSGIISCVCNPELGYGGRACSVDIDECRESNTTCPSNKRCINREGGYECICLGDTVGQNCEYKRGCLDPYLPCGYGTCATTHMDTAVCACEPGWQGKHCLDDVDECEFDTLNTCNDNQVCFNQVGNYTCVDKASLKIVYTKNLHKNLESEFTIGDFVNAYHVEIIFAGIIIIIGILIYGYLRNAQDVKTNL